MITMMHNEHYLLYDFSQKQLTQICVCVGGGGGGVAAQYHLLTNAVHPAVNGYHQNESSVQNETPLHQLKFCESERCLEIEIITSG